MAENDEFEVTLDPEGKAPKKKPKDLGNQPIVRVGKSGGKKETYTIVVEEEENQQNYVAVGVDGKVYQIMRGVEVEVPYTVLHVLENSKATRLVKELGADGKAIYVEREYNTVPYRVLR